MIDIVQVITENMAIEFLNRYEMTTNNLANYIRELQDDLDNGDIRIDEDAKIQWVIRRCGRQIGNHPPCENIVYCRAYEYCGDCMTDELGLADGFEDV